MNSFDSVFCAETILSEYMTLYIYTKLYIDKYTNYLHMQLYYMQIYMVLYANIYGWGVHFKKNEKFLGGDGRLSPEDN